MSKMRVTAAIAAALVVGLVAGNVVSGFAAPAPAPSATETAGPLAGMGLRMGAAMRDAGGRMVDVLAKLTGLSVDQIHEQRADGKSIADIAKAEGVDPDKVVGDTIAIRKQMLDELVTEGKITAEQRDAALERMTTRMNDRVDSTELGRGMGGKRGGRGMGGGTGGAGCGAAGQGGGCGGSCTTATQ